MAAYTATSTFSASASQPMRGASYDGTPRRRDRCAAVRGRHGRVRGGGGGGQLPERRGGTGVHGARGSRRLVWHSPARGGAVDRPRRGGVAARGLDRAAA